MDEVAATRGFRIRRACYDKAHRCPGWAGGGMRYPKRSVCENGYFPYLDNRFLDRIAIRRCTECGTVRLPIFTKWIDPTWLGYWVSSRLGRRIENWRLDRAYRLSSATPSKLLPVSTVEEEQ